MSSWWPHQVIPMLTIVVSAEMTKQAYSYHLIHKKTLKSKHKAACRWITAIKFKFRHFFFGSTVVDHWCHVTKIKLKKKRISFSMISFNKGEYGKHTFFHQGISDSILSRFLKLKIIKIDFKIISDIQWNHQAQIHYANRSCLIQVKWLRNSAKKKELL